MRSLLVSSPEFWRGLVDSLAGAADERAACAAITREVSRALNTHSWIIERAADHIGIVASGHNAAVDVEAVLPAALIADVEQRASMSEGRPVDLGRWTALALGNTDRAMALIVAGDAAMLEPRLDALALWLPAALAAVRERALRARAEALVVDAYRLARRAGRLGALDTVCRHIVDQAARSLSAERVAVALYQPAEHGLVVAATYGYPFSTVENARIEPGEWVIGHVFASRRAILVHDVRRLRALSVVTRRYRTFSFAAVPIISERRVIGVLCATDKIDGANFTRRDVRTLRTIGGVGALGLMAARGDLETRRLARAATVDSLTGLFNRQFFDLRLNQEVERARRASSTLTVLIIDIDDFKVINDTYGHPVGDAVLQSTANILRSAVRVFDVCARYGGDEFAIVMPNSDRMSAAASAERIRDSVASSCSRVAGLADLSRVTVSAGVAVMDSNEAPEQILARADQSLYRAKADGKNCVRIASSRRAVPLSNVPRSDSRT